MTHLDTWLADPAGGECFLRQAELIRQHNPDCPSLESVWLPRYGGVSDLIDTMECEVCQLTFFWDGLSTAHENCPESNHWVCHCCTQATCGCTPAGT